MKALFVYPQARFNCCPASWKRAGPTFIFLLLLHGLKRVWDFMTNADDLFLFDAFIPDLRATNVRQVYQTVSDKVGQDISVPAAALCEKFMEQEQRATSGIGNGIALPHLRLRKLKKPYTLFARLPQLVDFNAIDDQPVNLLCLLLSPDNNVAAHLRNLSRLTRLLRDDTLRLQLQEARNEDSLQAIMLASHQKQRAA
jgi:nitrogen PTS system EIIA component